MGIKNEIWWINNGLSLVDLEDRSMIIINILSNKNNSQIKKYFSLFNFYNGRNTINSLMEYLDKLLKRDIRKSIIYNQNINYIFLTPRLLPYYNKKEYPEIEEYSNNIDKLCNEEKIFIKNFLDDFSKFIKFVIDSSIIENCDYNLYTRISKKLNIFIEKISLCELKIYLL